MIIIYTKGGREKGQKRFIYEQISIKAERKTFKG